MTKTNLDIAKQAVLQAAEAVMHIYQQTDHGIEFKESDQPVTTADKLAHNIIIQQLANNSANPVFSEEHPNDLIHLTNPSSDIWVIDPLDGTKNFIERGNEFSIMIALLRGQTIELGVVYNPVTQEMFWAEKGKGAWKKKRHEQPLKLSVRVTSKPVMAVSRHHFKPDDEDMARRLGVTETFPMSSIGLKAACIAEGKADLYINMDGLNLWDIAPAFLLIKEAGGTAIDKSGNELFPVNPVPKRFINGIIMANMSLIKAAKKELQ